MGIFYLKRIRIFCLVAVILSVFTVTVYGGEPELVEFSGLVKNHKNRKPVGNVSVTVPGSNIGTVTNDDGYFNVKVPQEFVSNGLKIDHIGYQSQFLSPKLFEGKTENLTIYLQPTGKVLDELYVLGGEPKEIVKEALRKIPDNYASSDNLLKGFYRETVQKGNRFINISEGIVDVLKKPYGHRSTYGEKVRIEKGRSLVSPRASDTLSVKLMGGPFMPLNLDAVKNGDHLFTEQELDYFEFKLESPAMIDDRIHYAISFKPIVTKSYPLNTGIIYIDGETLTISRVEFSLDMKDKEKVTRAILDRKPSGLHFKPLEVSGVVTYKVNDGKSYINYISSVIKFKCDWKKRLFSSTYTSRAEMVMTDREELHDKGRKFENPLKRRNIFSDNVGYYWDEDFWKDYNIIEPTESLDKAVEKLKK